MSVPTFAVTALECANKESILALPSLAMPR
jgi:hypothetical protein